MFGIITTFKEVQMQLTNKETIYHVSLSKAELEFIRGFSQNPHPDSSDEDKEILLSLWVGSNRALGIDVDDAGTILRKP